MKYFNDRQKLTGFVFSWWADEIINLWFREGSSGWSMNTKNDELASFLYYLFCCCLLVRNCAFERRSLSGKPGKCWQWLILRFIAYATTRMTCHSSRFLSEIRGTLLNVFSKFSRYMDKNEWAIKSKSYEHTLKENHNTQLLFPAINILFCFSLDEIFVCVWRCDQNIISLCNNAIYNKWILLTKNPLAVKIITPHS